MRFRPLLFTAPSEDAVSKIPHLAGKVALVVTSPPYHNSISYRSHQSDERADYRVREDGDYGDEYLELLGRVWHQCWELLRPGGHLAVNVGTVLLNGAHFPLSLDVQHQLRDSSDPWQFIRTIHWHKVTAGVRRAGGVIQHRLPGYWYPNIMSEHIILVRKPGRPVVANRDVPKDWWECVWDLAPVPPRTVEHPAPFPEDLPHRLIRMLTKEGDQVLDPFNGAGATTKAAFDLNRIGVGFDISSQYTAVAELRTDAGSSVRSSQLRMVPIEPSSFEPKRRHEPARQGTGRSARRRSTRG